MGNLSLGNLNSNMGQVTDLQTNAKIVVGSINEVFNKVGNVSGVNSSSASNNLSLMVEEIRKGAYSVYRTSKSNGIFTVITLKRKDGTTAMVSTLYNYDAVNFRYNNRKEEYYDKTGLTIVDTIVYSLSYDVTDGSLQNEVIN